jgi:bacterial/archaeal transporter family-2 protein
VDNQALAIGATVVAGAFIATQAPINATLGKAIGSPFAAAAISFAVGTAALVAITLLFAGGFGGVGGGVRGLSWVYLTGGFLGAVYVTTALITVSTLGAGAVTAATVCGQLVTALAIDRFGLLGLDGRPLTVSRLLGVVLLVAGTFLIVRGE